MSRRTRYLISRRIPSTDWRAVEVLLIVLMVISGLQVALLIVYLVAHFVFGVPVHGTVHGHV